MKKTLKLMAFALLALGMLACGGNAKKITVEELREAQSILFNENGTLNEKEAPKVVALSCHGNQFDAERFEEKHRDWKSTFGAIPSVEMGSPNLVDFGLFCLQRPT